MRYNHQNASLVGKRYCKVDCAIVRFDLPHMQPIEQPGEHHLRYVCLGKIGNTCRRNQLLIGGGLVMHIVNNDKDAPFMKPTIETIHTDPKHVGQLPPRQSLQQR
jgi:hypothetical protein